MGRMYSVLMDNVSVTAAITLMRISAASDSVIILHEVKVTNDDVETSQQLPVQIFRVTTDGTGTSYTATLLSAGDAAFGGTAVVNCSAEPTAGDILWRDSQNALNGWHYLPTPESRIVVSPSARIAIKLDEAPAAAVKFSVTAIIEEIGG